MKKYILILFAFICLISADKPLPRVLIIGDSISLGYTPFVQEIMKGEAVVIQNGSSNNGNARYTGYGVENIDQWLSEGNWDLIHFNFGLWDLYGWRYADSLRTPETYAFNLEIIIGKMEKTGAKLIWATTSPVCLGPEKNRPIIIDLKTEKAFRKAALKVMKKHHIPVNDLYKAIQPKMKIYSLGDNNVHYNKDGYRFLAEQVSIEIRKYLN